MTARQPKGKDSIIFEDENVRIFKDDGGIFVQNKLNPHVCVAIEIQFDLKGFMVSFDKGCVVEKDSIFYYVHGE